MHASFQSDLDFARQASERSSGYQLGAPGELPHVLRGILMLLYFEDEAVKARAWPCPSLTRWRSSATAFPTASSSSGCRRHLRAVVLLRGPAAAQREAGRAAAGRGRRARAGARHLHAGHAPPGHAAGTWPSRPARWSASASSAAFLAQLFDAVITVDPHLHRIATLGEAIPVKPIRSCSAAPCAGRLDRARASGALLLGPDEEAAQWVEQAAARIWA